MRLRYYRKFLLLYIEISKLIRKIIFFFLNIGSYVKFTLERSVKN